MAVVRGNSEAASHLCCRLLLILWRCFRYPQHDCPALYCLLLLILTALCRLHRRQSPGVHNRPHLAFELRPLRMSNDVELLKPDGELSEDEDITLRRTIAALVLNLRGIDPDLRESGLDMLCGLAARRWVQHFSLIGERILQDREYVQHTPHLWESNLARIGWGRTATRKRSCLFCAQGSIIYCRIYA